MGRKRSDYECPKCGKLGFVRSNPTAVVHYDHRTRKRSTCYMKKLISKTENQDQNGYQPTEDPPKKFWGKSELYFKLEDMATHFHKIGEQLDKVKMQVYKFRPKPQVSAKCVKHLDIFEEQFLNPVEKLLIPYYDERWSGFWPDFFKLQMDNFRHGPRAAGKINAVGTGEFILKEYKDGRKRIEELNVLLSAYQVKKKEQKTLEFAKQIVKSYPLEQALHNWAKKTRLVEE